MTEPQVFIAAEQALTEVVDQIKDDQWNMSIPEWFKLSPKEDRASLDLRQMINDHAYDDSWVPETLAGKTIDEVGIKYDGDLLGADTKLPNELVQGMWDLFELEAEQWRAMGVFGLAILVPEDASLQDRLLGLVGRNPL